MTRQRYPRHLYTAQFSDASLTSKYRPRANTAIPGSPLRRFASVATSKQSSGDQPEHESGEQCQNEPRSEDADELEDSNGQVPEDRQESEAARSDIMFVH